MVRTRKERKKETTGTDFPLRQPDRSAPSEKTLIDLASDRDLFTQADRRQAQLARNNKNNGAANKEDDDSGAEENDDLPVLSPGADRFLEALLYTVTMAMGHFTFDVLVQHQYAVEVNWYTISERTAKAWIVFFILFWPLHPHDSNPHFFPLLPAKHQHTARELIFFAMSALCGCFLIYVTNSKGYLANMKRAPPLAVLWLWAVVELDLVWATGSLVVAGAYLWWNGYSIT